MTGRRRARFAADMARRLPCVVTVEAAPDGLGQRLNDMLEWCGAHLAAGAWFNIGGEFRFADPAAADSFRAAFPDLADRDQG